MDVVEHASADAFWAWAAGRRVHLFSAKGDRPHSRCPFAPGDVLLFGRESVGLPTELVEQHGAWCIPMTGAVRSLNLSNAIAVVAYAALERVRPELF